MKFRILFLIILLSVPYAFTQNKQIENQKDPLQWAKGIVWYQIFPERFCNGNTDNDPTLEGAELSNIDANKGIVDNYYEPYEACLELMAGINRQVYDLADYFDREVTDNDRKEQE